MQNKCLLDIGFQVLKGLLQGVNQAFLITFSYIIFPIHLNFPITSRCFLKTSFIEKTVDCFEVT